MELIVRFYVGQKDLDSWERALTVQEIDRFLH